MAKNKTDARCNEKFLDQLDDKRTTAALTSGTFCSNREPSRYPGFYEAGDIDDGRLDPAAARSHFVSTDQIPDNHEPYEPDEDDGDPVEAGPAQRPAFVEPLDNEPSLCRRSTMDFTSRLPRPLAIKVEVILNGRRRPYEGSLRKWLSTQR